jgi:hypothetical protein
MPFDSMPNPDSYLDEPSRVLLRASEIIREHGLAVGSGTNAVGGVCTVMAIALASGVNIGAHTGAYFGGCRTEAAAKMAAHLGLKDAWELDNWNDDRIVTRRPVFWGLWSVKEARRRTAEEVATTMERVALSHVTAEVR